MQVSHHKLLAMLASTLVFVAILVGLFVAGSPADERLRRLDSIRIQHLQALNAAIDLHIRRRNFMPTRLADAVDGQQLSILPTDPENGDQYDYIQINSSSYELCAVFASAAADSAGPNFWAHPAGRACFTFQVGPGSVLQ